MTTGLASRAIRAATFAAVCVVAAAAGHSLASGTGVSPLALGSAFAGTASAAWWLAGRERGAFAVTGATVVSQLALHVLFSLMDRSASMTAHGHAGHIPGVAYEARAGLSPPTGRPGAADAAEPLARPVAGPQGAGPDGLEGLTPFCHGWGMLLAHVLAALACGLWLWRGERAAYRLGRALAAAVFVPLRIAYRGLVASPRRCPRPRLTRTSRVRRPRQLILRHVLAGRAPPHRLALR
ncbi:hypothetical protein [Streptomyces buecherae]|uniref:Integral membrane protein n=1 Tax=Streptomyces buecherae TaxID=2763006 RepID=A0A7H8N4X8_9ACTN|nr:hypothetical protein [Streptomyces buecherae]QKW49545.1 hypothetical protein HUT08_08220 [Streptomyces buecherae]